MIKKVLLNGKKNKEFFYLMDCSQNYKHIDHPNQMLIVYENTKELNSVVDNKGVI